MNCGSDCSGSWTLPRLTTVPSYSLLCLRGGEEVCLVVRTLLQIQLELGLGDFKEAAAQIYQEEYISVV